MWSKDRRPERYCMKLFCNFQLLFVVCLTLALQLFLLDYFPPSPAGDNKGRGYVLYYAGQNVRVHFADYADSVRQRLYVRPVTSSVRRCDSSAYDLHDASGMPRREALPMQPLGDTIVRVVSAYLDARGGRRFLRILSVGLYPGPADELYCSYDCEHARACSSPVTGVVLVAGGRHDYSKYSSMWYWDNAYAI